MLSKNLITDINEQINFELLSEYLYLSMAAYFEDQNLPGFANFFKVQVQEERFHAMKFFDYLNQMDGRVILKSIEAPENDFEGALDVFEKSLNHEKKVTKRIYNLMDVALDEKEHATISLLKWFIDEQVEEEDNFNTLVKKLKRANNDPTLIYMLNEELSLRVFTPPTL
ncbi:MAG: ferritin [Clostridiaceae bacterium]